MKLALQLAGAILLLGAPGVCSDQKSKPAPPPKPAARVPGPNRSSGPSAGGTPKNGAAGLNNPMNPAQRLMQMTPEQRERILEKLPPDQQARIRQQLERLDHLSPAEKEMISRQGQSLAALPPDRQRTIQQGITGMNRLPAERRGPVRRELLALLDLSEEDRAARLKSDDFKQKFAPEEQKILSDLSLNLPADYPLAGRR